MENDSKGQPNSPIPPGNETRSMLFGLVGGYMLYLAYQVLHGTINGTSSMSVAVTMLSVVFLSVSGLGIMAYAFRLWQRYRKEQQAAESAEEAENTR